MGRVRSLWLLDLRKPERVERNGHGYGGPLKLYHRDRNYIIIKWPSYTQWAGTGCRDANKTTYFLLRIVEKDPMISREFIGKPPEQWPGWVKAAWVKEIEPGRKRSLVKALVEDCKTLANEWGSKKKGSKRKQCGKSGCGKPTTGQVHGSLLYNTCDEHRAEIEALVDSE